MVDFQHLLSPLFPLTSLTPHISPYPTPTHASHLMSSRVHCPLPARTHTSHAASILRPLSQAEQETSLFSPKPKAQYTLAERKQYWLSQDDLKRRPKQGRGEGEGGLAGRVPRIKVRGTEMGMEEGGLQAVVALTVSEGFCLLRLILPVRALHLPSRSFPSLRRLPYHRSFTPSLRSSKTSPSSPPTLQLPLLLPQLLKPRFVSLPHPIPQHFTSPPRASSPCPLAAVC